MSRRCYSRRSRMGSTVVSSSLGEGREVDCTLRSVVVVAFFGSDTFCCCLFGDSLGYACLQSCGPVLGSAYDDAVAAAAAVCFDWMIGLAVCSPWLWQPC